MASKKLTLPSIPESEQSPLVEKLLEIIERQQKRIEEQDEEIRRLKGHPKKPQIKPSKMDEETEPKKAKEKPQKRTTEKTQALIVHEERKIAPKGLPANARELGYRFKGYSDYVVQDLVIKPHTTRYRLEQWQTPTGQYLRAELPPSVKGHYGYKLVSYLLYQYHHQQVTQPLLLESLREFGIEISASQLSQLLTHGHESFHQEKAQLLTVGLQISTHIQTDDTGARHAGKNGYCTYIGNEFFAWFESTQSKSRINFLSLLRSEKKSYVLNAGALAYMSQYRLPKDKLNQLEADLVFKNKTAFKAYLQSLNITHSRHVQIITEGALVGSLLANGLPADMGIVSDEAGQFNVFRHALCWIHVERNINKLVPLNPTHAKQIKWVRAQVWELYANLKQYKTKVTCQHTEFAEIIQAHFDELCRTQTTYQTLNEQLKRLARRKRELLRVLDDPTLPLHNNLSERDIREYVKRRKISGSTRSEVGRRCRDTFASLKKTCRKHGLSFWKYLCDRVSRHNSISPLVDYLRQAASASTF